MTNTFTSPLRLARLGALCATLAAPVATRAEPESKKAQVHAELGMNHFRGGRYQEAVEEFLQAASTLDDAGLFWNMARAYEELGDVPNALHYFERLAAKFPDDRSAESAREKIEALRSKLPGHVIVRCGEVPGIRASVDGGDKVPCGDRIGPLKPGKHVVEATAVGYEPWRQTVEVKAGGKLEVEAELKAIEEKPDEPPVPPEPPQPVEPPEPPVEPPGPWGDYALWGGAGFAAGAVVVGGVALFVLQPGWVEVPETRLGEQEAFGD